MKQVIKKLGAEIASQVEKTAKDFSDFSSGAIVVNKDNKKNVTGYSCEFRYVVTDKDNNTIARRGIVEASNNVEKWYIFDVKNGQITNKKKLVKVVVGDTQLDNNQAKHGVKPNIDGVNTTIASNLGLIVEDLDGIDFSDVVTAKTAEEKTAAFMLAIAQSSNFPALAENLQQLAREAEKATRAAKATENSYIQVCKDNNILVADFEAAFAITNDKLEAVAAVKLAMKKKITIAKAVQTYRALFA